ncbi:MAG: hypothetical protein KAQ68_07695 [Clostridiales bacterium]|nr:hypothetical protein [Clostridiales bacterium]
MISTVHPEAWSYNAVIILNETTPPNDTQTIQAVSLKVHTQVSGGLLFRDYLFCGALYSSFIKNHFENPFSWRMKLH